MLRGNSGQDIFFDEDDRYDFYDLIGRVWNGSVTAFMGFVS